MLLWVLLVNIMDFVETHCNASLRSCQFRGIIKHDRTAASNRFESDLFVHAVAKGFVFGMAAAAEIRRVSHGQFVALRIGECKVAFDDEWSVVADDTFGFFCWFFHCLFFKY
jgi:hypothetical protein